MTDFFSRLSANFQLAKTLTTLILIGKIVLIELTDKQLKIISSPSACLSLILYLSFDTFTSGVISHPGERSKNINSYIARYKSKTLTYNNLLQLFFCVDYYIQIIATAISEYTIQGRSVRIRKEIPPNFL